MQPPARLTPALLVLALLAASPALPQAHRGAPPRSTSFAEALRGFVPDFMARLWGDLGCVVDPFGGCRTAARVELGCDVDPYGRCKPATAPPLTSLRGDLGCDVDPFGRCASAASPTNGSH